MSKAATQVFTQASQDNNEAFDFPDGWVEINIGSVVDLNPGKPPADAVPHDAYVTFVPMPAVDAYSGKITAPKDRPFGAVRKGYTAFQEDDVIFAKITPCMENGKSAIARNLTNGLGFGSTEFHVLRSTRAVIPEYLYYYIRQESFRRNAEAEMTGSVGQRRVPVEFIKNSLLPLPPLAEQKRIVAKVEELLARVNTARERVAKVQEILKRFRQSVLATACSGRLTAEWRDHQIEIEPVSVLIKRLQQKHPEWAKAGLSDEEDLPDIPEHWEWTKVGQIGDITTGNTPPKKEAAYFGGPIHFFKPTDLDAGYYVENSIDSLSQQGAQLARVLTPLAVMVTCIGATIGKTGLARVEGATNQQINSVVTDEVFVSPHFLFWLITSPLVQEQIRLRASETTLPILNKGRFQRLPLPIPPLAEQHEIVQRVEALFKLADAIEKRVAVATVRAEKITQAVLSKALRGELVTTEAELALREGRSYEPASALLAKIKVQQRDVKPQRKRGRALQRKNDISGLTS